MTSIHTHTHVQFWQKEWETLVIIALIVGTIVYLGCNGKRIKDKFREDRYVYDRRSSTQAHYVVDDRRGRDSGPPIDNTGYVLPTDIAENFDTPGIVLSGRRHVLQGPNVSRFMDFEAIDKLDDLAKNGATPGYQPATPDEELINRIGI